MKSRHAIIVAIMGISAFCGLKPVQSSHNRRTTAAQPPANWAAARVRPTAVIRADKAVALYQRTQGRYASVARPTGAPPAPVLFGLHSRESDCSFNTNLANGDPLTHKTYHVPKGRIPGVSPPYDWETAAEDALQLDNMYSKNWSNIDSTLDAVEGFNGFGYRKKGIPSPYVWSGTDQYVRGKYVADGRFSRTSVDSQLGVAAILKQMQTRGIKLPW